jgi:hypothetical protein
MFGVIVRCPDGYLEMPWVSESEYLADVRAAEIGRDRNWYGPENVWVEEIEEASLAQ